VRDRKIWGLIRSFAIEMVIYGVLLVAYVYFVLRLLADPLARLFEGNLLIYAIAGLVLIVAQAVLLETVTSLIVRWLGLERLE
jgi:hypothetical protein